MLVQQKKRQSFSIDSLAISSCVQDDDGPHRRDTDSPYLNYIQSDNAPAVDYNLNFQHPPPSLTFSANHLCQDGIVNKPGIFDQHVNDNIQSLQIHTTSTPKTTSLKRKRSCSTSKTSPSSDESCEENMMIDSSANTDDMSDGKLSPLSAASLSTMSEADTESLGDDGEGNRRKKARTAFTGEQLRELERRYKSQKYLTANDRTHLARSLRLKDQQVKTWFQNRRMKEKRQQREDDHSTGFHLPTGGVDIAQLAALGVCAPPQSQFLGSPQPLNYNFNAAVSPATREQQLSGFVIRNTNEPAGQTSPSPQQDRTSPLHQTDTSASGGSMFTALDMRAARDLRQRLAVTSVNNGASSGIQIPVPIISQFGLRTGYSHSPISVPVFPH